MATRLPPATAGSPVFILPYHFTSITADATAAVRIKLPCAAVVAGFSASARASSGTSPTLTANLKIGGTTALSAVLAITAAATAEATISAGTVADEAIITVDFDIGGTDTPTFLDVDLLITLIRV